MTINLNNNLNDNLNDKYKFNALSGYEKILDKMVVDLSEIKEREIYTRYVNVVSKLLSVKYNKDIVSHYTIKVNKYYTEDTNDFILSEFDKILSSLTSEDTYKLILSDFEEQLESNDLVINIYKNGIKVLEKFIDELGLGKDDSDTLDYLLNRYYYLRINKEDLSFDEVDSLLDELDNLIEEEVNYLNNTEMSIDTEDIDNNSITNESEDLALDLIEDNSTKNSQEKENVYRKRAVNSLDILMDEDDKVEVDINNNISIDDTDIEEEDRKLEAKKRQIDLDKQSKLNNNNNSHSDDDFDNLYENLDDLEDDDENIIVDVNDDDDDDSVLSIYEEEDKPKSKVNNANKLDSYLGVTKNKNK